MAPKKWLRNPVAREIELARAELDLIDATRPDHALPHLRAAQDHLTTALDEAMAATILAKGATIRSTGELAGLSENAVGPRLARTSLLGAYGDERVTATGVERARYDLEEGRHRTPQPAAPSPTPSRFRARRPN